MSFLGIFLAIDTISFVKLKRHKYYPGTFEHLYSLSTYFFKRFLEHCAE